MEKCHELSPLGEVLSALGAPSPDFDLYEVIHSISENAGITVQDSTTIQLEGDGTSSSPLTAVLNEGAIQSSDGSILVERQEDGTFDITTDLEPADVTVSGSTSIDVVETPGNPIDYQVSLSPNALIPSPDPSMIPIIPAFTGGQYQLGILSSALGIIPRTIVVGGRIGTTPNASTLSDAIALLPAGITLEEPWTLLMLPGIYAGSDVMLPLNVNIVALMKGSVIIDNDVELTNQNLTIPAAIVLDGLIIRGMLKLVIITNGIATFRGLIINCDFSQGQFATLSATISAVPSPLASIAISNCRFLNTLGLLYLNGFINIRECIFVGMRIQVDSFNGDGTGFIDIEDSQLHTLNGLSLSASKTVRVTRCTIRERWDVVNTAPYIDLYSCTALSSWVCNGRFNYYDSSLRDEVIKTSPAAYTISSSNIGTSSGADRPISALLDNVDLTVSPVDITITLDPPLLSPFTAAAGTIPYATTGRSTIQVSSSADQVSVVSTSTSTVVLRLTGSGTANAWINILPPRK